MDKQAEVERVKRERKWGERETDRHRIGRKREREKEVAMRKGGRPRGGETKKGREEGGQEQGQGGRNRDRESDHRIIWLTTPFPTSVRCVKDNMANPKFLNELGLTILSLAQHIPSGVLVFLSSYKLLREAVGVWKSSGVSSSSSSCNVSLWAFLFSSIIVVRWAPKSLARLLDYRAVSDLCALR